MRQVRVKVHKHTGKESFKVTSQTEHELRANAQEVIELRRERDQFKHELKKLSINSAAICERYEEQIKTIRHATIQTFLFGCLGGLVLGVLLAIWFIKVFL